MSQQGSVAITLDDGGVVVIVGELLAVVGAVVLGVGVPVAGLQSGNVVLNGKSTPPLDVVESINNCTEAAPLESNVKTGKVKSPCASVELTRAVY